MAVTQNTYTGDGTTVLFSFTFPYLETTDIKVSVNGSTTTAYTLANATTIQFNTAPANGAAIRIYRQTDDSALAATFYPGSAIRSSDLNENFTQNLYVTQESSNNATTATTTANTALTNSTTAISTANTALSTANTASTNASAAVTTANTASTNASAAVSTANTANTNASAAVATANTASTNASAAVSTANTASTNASQALTTANSAVSTANSAVTTANTAASNANTAISTANTALSTANSASSTASSAVTTANTASTNATAALNAVANSLQYVLVANVAAIPSSPANNYAIELADSTGVESFTPLANRPAGFVGDVGLSVRMQYSTTGPTWNWLNYFPNNAETRYLKLAGGTLTGQLKADDSTSVAAPVIAFDGDTNTGIAHTGADELALVTGGTARLTIDPAGGVAITNSLSVGGQAAVVTNDARLTDTRTPTDGTVTDAKVAANAAIAGTKISPDFGTQNVTTSGNITVTNQGDIRLGEATANGSNYVALQAPATLAADVTYTLPSADGTSGQVLSTNGSGTLSWATAAAGGASVTTSDTPPATPNDGDLWYDSVGGRTYVYYQDPNGSQWVDASPQGGGGSGTSITTGNTTAEVIDTGSDGRFVVTTEGTERLRVTAAGLVGIGAASPNELLEVRGTADQGIRLTSTATNGEGANLQWYSELTGGNKVTAEIESDASGTGGNLQFKTANTSGTLTEAVRIDNTQRLLVGTTSVADSSYKVQIGGHTDETVRTNTLALYGYQTNQASGSIINQIIFGPSANSGAGGAKISQIKGSDNQSDSLAFFTGSTSLSERMRINSNGAITFGGKVGIGTDPDVYGSARITVNNTPSISQAFLISNFNGSSSEVHCRFKNGAGADGTITTNGSTTAYNTSSDYRLKENITPVTDGITRLQKLKPSRFNFILDPGRAVDGFIAHEVQDVVPEAIHGQKDAVDADGNPIYQGIDQSKLVPLLTAALQEAVARIEAQDTTIASQAATIAAIEARLTALEGGN